MQFIRESSATDQQSLSMISAYFKYLKKRLLTSCSSPLVECVKEHWSNLSWMLSCVLAPPMIHTIKGSIYDNAALSGCESYVRTLILTLTGNQKQPCKLCTSVYRSWYFMAEITEQQTQTSCVRINYLGYWLNVLGRSKSCTTVKLS